jgi:diacylglycerol kinase (ATP)
VKSRIALVVRPPAEEARLNELRASVRALRRAGHRVVVRLTFEAGDARRYARGAARAGCDCVVAVGGDGTINGVVNGLVAAGGDAALGIVPLGTANDFARGLGLPERVGDALCVATQGSRVSVDVARVNRRCFINVSTGGFGANATRAASRGIKRVLGPLSYLFTGMRRLLEYRAREGRFVVDGRTVHEGGFAFFAVGNARQTGGGTTIAPRAEIGDGLLDVVLVGAVSRLDLVSLLPDLRAGTHLESPQVHYFRARTFRVEPRDCVAVNADGELVAGTTRYDYDILERGLKLMVPR